MRNQANDANFGPAVQSSGAEETSKVVDASVASDNPVTDIKVDREVPRWSVGEYMLGTGDGRFHRGGVLAH